MALSRVEYSRHVCLTYVRDLITAVMSTKVGCNISGFAYADDMVLLAPSWRALQYLINRLADCAFNIDMTMDRRKAIISVFPCFKLNDIELKYVNGFKYLGHIINNDEHDDKDVILCIFVFPMYISVSVHCLTFMFYGPVPEIKRSDLI